MLCILYYLQAYIFLFKKAHQGCFRDPKTIKADAIGLGYPPRTSKYERAIAEDTTHFDQKIWQNRGVMELEVSSLLARFHSTGRYHVGYSKRKIISTVPSCQLHEL